MSGFPMNIKPLYRKISLAEIDQKDQTYSLTPAYDELPSLPENADSLALRTITRPPLVLEKTSTKHQIITGRRLLEDISREAGSHACYCLVIPGETEPVKLLALALEDILASRPPSAAEQAICWQKAIAWSGEEKAKNVFGGRLVLANRFSGDKLTALAGLGDKTLAALHQGTLDLKVAFRLIDLEENDRDCLFEIIQMLLLSNSNQRKLLDLCNELHRRNNTAINEILSGDECNSIINHPEANPPQKTAMLMKWLRDCCLPRLTGTEAEFRKFIGKLAPPKGISINHAPSFENDTLSLTVQYNNREEFLESWPTIKDSFTSKKKQREHRPAVIEAPRDR